MHSGRSRAFTLTELLVVFAILIALLFLAFPVFQKTRGNSLASRCVNNLRQISTALFAYVADHDGVLPGSRYENRVDEDGKVWAGYYPWNTETLQPYLQTPRSLSTHLQRKGATHSVAGPFWCPAATDVEVTWATFTYIYNIYIGWHSNRTNGARTLGNVLRPHQTLYMIDHAPNESRSSLLQEATWPLPKGAPREHDETENLIDFKRHGGYANGLFMDGHIEKLTVDQLFRTRTRHLFARP